MGCGGFDGSGLEFQTLIEVVDDSSQALTYGPCLNVVVLHQIPYLLCPRTAEDKDKLVLILFKMLKKANCFSSLGLTVFALKVMKYPLVYDQQLGRQVSQHLYPEKRLHIFQFAFHETRQSAFDLPIFVHLLTLELGLLTFFSDKVNCEFIRIVGSLRHKRQKRHYELLAVGGDYKVLGSLFLNYVSQSTCQPPYGRGMKMDFRLLYAHYPGVGMQNFGEQINQLINAKSFIHKRGIYAG